MTKEESIFEKLYKVDVSAHIEKKGKYDYLPWQKAIHHLLEIYPTAKWEVVKHYREIKTENGLVRMGFPYFYDPAVKGFAVETSVEIEGITRNEILPVINFSMKVLPEPDWFQINTSHKRCLVKNIAMFGLGLNVYEGGDNWMQDVEQEEGQTVDSKKVVPIKKKLKVPEMPQEKKKLEPEEVVDMAKEVFGGTEVKLNKSQIKLVEKHLDGQFSEQQQKKIREAIPDLALFNSVSEAKKAMGKV
jgi:hypothetical protein